MKRRFRTVYLITFLGLLLFSCNKSNPLVTDTPANYYPMKTGNYIIYRMDSLKFINVGSRDTTISYLAKEVVEDSISDNLGRPSFRVVRYLSDTNGLSEWTPSIAFMVTPLSGSVEVVENNLRIIKMVTPVQDNISWLGNSYLDTKNDSSLTFMDGWNYTYINQGQPYDVLEGTIAQTVTVNEADETFSTPDGSYIQNVLSQEIYGKDIGPIYKKFLNTIYQSPNVQYPAGVTFGYGLTFNMVSHN
jgi:hypothetical protein